MLESCQYVRTCLRLPAHSIQSNSLGWRVGWRMATRSFCEEYMVSAAVPCLSSSSPPNTNCWSTYISGYQARLTFNICNSVVFPALSRPKNRSFACLFISPRAERVSQTIARYSYQQDVPERALEGRFAKGSWGAAKTATYTS